MKLLNTDFYRRCFRALETALNTIQQQTCDDVVYDIYRSACIKQFELILEQSGKLLRKCLKPYFSSPKQVDALTFNDVFRYAGKYSLLSLEQVDRWLNYRKIRNTTAHHYGERFAEETLVMMNDFLADAKALEQIIAQCLTQQNKP